MGLRQYCSYESGYREGIEDYKVNTLRERQNNMEAKEMKMGIPYRAISASTDGTITEGQYMWISKKGELCLPDNYGGGALEESEWMSAETSDFKVIEVTDYYIDICSGEESMRRRK